MHTSVLVSSALVFLLVESSLQEAFPESPRVARAYQGGGFGGQGFGGSPGFGRGQGSFGNQGGDSRYGFNIIDAPDRYGYEARYPGGRANFFLLGPNRGPGQQGGRRGLNQGSYQGGYQQGGGSQQGGGYQQGGGHQQGSGYQQGGGYQGGRGGW